MSRLVYVILSLARVVMQRCFLFLPSKQRVQEEDRFLSMPPKQCLRPQKHWPPPDNACMPRRRKGIVAEYSTWRRRTINKKPTKKTALSPMLLEVKNNLPRSKDKKAPSNNWENASRDTSETYQTTQKYMYLQCTKIRLSKEFWNTVLFVSQCVSDLWFYWQSFRLFYGVLWVTTSAITRFLGTLARLSI